MGLYIDLLKKIAHFQVRHPYFSILFLAVFTIIILGGVSKVLSLLAFSATLTKDINEIKSFNSLRDNNMGEDLIAIAISIDKNSVIENGVRDVKSSEIFNYLVELEDNLKKESDVGNIFSYADIILSYKQVYDESYDVLIHDEKILEQMESFVNPDSTTTILLINTDIATNDVRVNSLSKRILEVSNSISKPNGVDIKLTGTPIIQQKLGELISEDRDNTQLISTVLVFLITAILFRSILGAIVPILVVTISINWLYGTMGYTNLPISTLAGGVAAMVIGIGIDFAVHIMNKFKIVRKKGGSVAMAVEMAVVQTGSALTSTSLTTIAAFLAFLIGAMPEMGKFGILMSIGIFYSLVFSIFGLPAFLVVEEKIIYYMKNNTKFGIDQELHLEGNVDNKNNKIKKNNIRVGGLKKNV